MSLDDPDLSAMIRRHATRHAAPDALRAGLRTQLALADAARAPVPNGAPPRRRFTSVWGAACASFVLGVAATLVVAPLVQRLGPELSLDAELVADHVRALQTGRVTEVTSTDRHTVKPWFQGKLSYAPPVVDLAAEGFVLTGGRVEQVRGEAVATLAYARRLHVIDVFVRPGAEPTAPAASQVRGFHLQHWSDGAMQYWAVSDLDAGELAQFAQLLRERVARP